MEISTVISAVAAAFSAVCAFLAYRHSVKAKFAADEAERPYLSFESGEVVEEKQPSGSAIPTVNPNTPPVAIMKGNVLNRGQRPASNVRFLILLINSHLRNTPRITKENLADDIPHGADWYMQLAKFPVPSPNVGGEYVVVGLSYDDQKTSKTYTELFFMKWSGVQGGIVDGNISAATADEKADLLSRYRSELQPFV